MTVYTPAHYTALATLFEDFRIEVRGLLGLFRVDVAGTVCELPLAHSWQPIPGVPGVEMATLDPSEWPADADPAADYHLLRGPATHSPGLLKVPQAIRLEVIAGHQRYWKESAPQYIDYRPGDVFTCAPGEGHQWETLEPFRNRVSFSPALFTAQHATPPL